MADNDLLKSYQKEIAKLEKILSDYRILVANTPDLLYRTDLEGRITFVSSSVEPLSGYSVEEAIGMKMAEEVYLYPEEREKFLETLRENGKVRNFQAQLKRKDGSIWWASTNAHFHVDKQGNVLGVEGITRDVDELKKAEEAQRKSEELFRLTFQTSPDAINLNRVVDGMYIDINDGFTRIMEYSREDVIGKSSLSLNIWHTPEDREKLVKGLLENGFVDNLEAKFISKSGRIKTGLMSARLLHIQDEQVILSITRDITDRIHLEKQLRQAQRFESLGTLAGGIAHDFNNLLMGIQGRASLIGVEVGRDSPVYDHVKGIEEYVRSATNLTRQILGFARGGKYQAKPVDINKLIRKSAEMFGRTAKDVRLHYSQHEGKLVAEVDQQQLDQVFLNIFVNASQAMSHGGDLYITTSIEVIAQELSEAHNLNPGEYLKISIVDNGSGMDEKTQQLAFDPFFTTKDKERGTGLGLASALGIIKNHLGCITLSSQLGEGTTVDIYLPSSADNPVEEMPSTERIVKGGETILLVDDEKLVSDVASAMLESLGYQVYVASGGYQAIEIISERGKEIDLVILDLIMPEMDGQKTFSAIRGMEPNMPVLLSSGYSMDGQSSEMLKKGSNGFIQKPFTLSELSKKLREILDK